MLCEKAEETIYVVLENLMFRNLVLPFIYNKTLHGSCVSSKLFKSAAGEAKNLLTKFPGLEELLIKTIRLLRFKILLIYEVFSYIFARAHNTG